MSKFDDIPDSGRSDSPPIQARPISAPPTSPGALGAGGVPVARRVSPLLLPGYSRVAALVDLIVFSAPFIILALVVHFSVSAAQLPAAADSAEQVNTESYEQSNAGSDQAGASPAVAPEAVTRATSAADDRSSGALFNFGVTILFGFGCVGFVLLLLRFRRQRVETIGLTMRNLRVDLLWSLVVLAAMYAAHLLGAFSTMLLLPDGWRELSENAEQIDAFMPDIAWPYYLLLFGSVGLYEEVIFRGLLLTRIRCLVTRWWAAVPICAWVFALLHLGMQKAVVLPSLFGLGCVLSVFTIWRRSLTPAIVGHCLFNTSQILGLHLIKTYWPEAMPGAM